MWQPDQGSAEGNDIGAALQHAVGLHQSGRVDEAVRIYDQILKTLPNQPDALNFKGLAAHQKGNFETALKVGKPVARDAAKAASRYVVSECLLARDHILQGIERLDTASTASKPEQVQHPIELMAISYKD